jgi:hypothetical protein
MPISGKLAIHLWMGTKLLLPSHLVRLPLLEIRMNLFVQLLQCAVGFHFIQYYRQDRIDVFAGRSFRDDKDIIEAVV